MPLVFNGVTVEKIIYNGTELDKLVYNGVEVFTKQTGPITIVANGTTQSGYTVVSNFCGDHGAGGDYQSGADYLGVRVRGNGDEGSEARGYGCLLCGAGSGSFSPINMTNYTKARFTVYQRSGTIGYAYCGVRTDNPSATSSSIAGTNASKYTSAWSAYTAISAVSSGGNVEYVVDISNLTGNYYAGIWLVSQESDNYGYLRISKLVLE